MEFIKIGKIIKPFGLKGEMKIDTYTDFIKERFMRDSFVYILKDSNYVPYQVAKYRMHKGQLLLTLKDYEDINLIEDLKNLDIYKNKADIKSLKKGEYYFSDLRDLDVFVKDIKVGRVLRVEEGPKYNYLRVIKEDGSSSLVPFIDNFISKVDLDDKRIDINHIEGLL